MCMAKSKCDCKSAPLNSQCMGNVVSTTLIGVGNNAPDEGCNRNVQTLGIY